MADTVRSLLAAAAPSLEIPVSGTVCVEMPGGVAVGDPASALGAAVAKIFPGVDLPPDAVLVLQTDARDLDDAVAVPGLMTADLFDGPAGSAPSAAVWAIVNGVTLDGAGNAIFDQAATSGRSLRLAATKPLTGMAWRAEIAALGNAGNGSRTFTLAVTRLNDPRFGLSIVQAGGGLQCRILDSSHGSTQLAVPQWNAAAMRHWRIRQANTSVAWETSADGVTWTQRAVAADPGWLDEPCRYDIGSAVYAGGTSVDPVKVAAVALG